MQIRGKHSGFRPEIQGLRAIAVSLVLVYHLWPTWLPGGYTGVDVFFVISGYLITGLLLRELDAAGGISLARFYVRRVRRLLPASVLTLIVTLAVTVLLLPVTAWRGVAQEVGAAALYFENWWLAFKAVDYLAIESAASPVQHFWSLSVEEQYYFVWPALLAALYAFHQRFASQFRLRAICAACLGLVVAASFAYSILMGLSGETAAYFSSFARIWQLAAGGLLAVLGASAARPRPPVLLLGLAGIISAALLLNDDVAYPGYAALLPTVAAMLAIQAGAAYPNSRATSWLGSRPVQYLGDISYSLYLWHWPIIVFARHYFGDSIGLGGNVALLAASIVLAGLSKRFIEDAFRSGRATTLPSWRVLTYAVSASLACVGLATLLVVSIGNDTQEASLSAGRSAYPGAAAMLRPGPSQGANDGKFLPALVDVQEDVATAYAQGCIQNIQGVDVKTCTYGKDTAKYRIAVVGDSHAVHWFPAFEEIARHSDVQVVGISKTSCITAGLPLHHRKLKSDYPQCSEWTSNVVAYLNSRHFDYVVLSQSPRHRLYGAKRPEESADRLAAGMRQVWSGLARGPRIHVLRPTPWQPTVVRECVASKGGVFAKCTGTQQTVLSDDVMTRFARLAHYPLIDFTDLFCRDGQCPAVIGNVFVYRDAHHITATYARTLAPMLAERLGLPGAAAIAKPSPQGAEKLFDARPSPARAAQDRGEAFADGCVQSLKRHAVISCRYGLPQGKPRIAVVGDSMGANLVPALNAAATTKGWSMDTYFKDSCLFGAAPVYNRRLKRPFTECSRWNEAVLQRLRASAPDLVILTQSPQYTDERTHTYDQASPVLEIGISAYISSLHRAGIRVAVLRYLPWMPFNVPQCLMARGSADECSTNRALGMRDGPLLRIARRSSEIEVIDVNGEFCGSEACIPIIDGVLVYRDAMQPTATFARTLDGEIAKQLAPLLTSADSGTIATGALY